MVGGVRRSRLPGRVRLARDRGPARCAGSRSRPPDRGARLPGPLHAGDQGAARGARRDIPVTSVAAQLGGDTAAELERITLEVYRRGTVLAAVGGVIVADTKVGSATTRSGTCCWPTGTYAPFVQASPADQWRPGRRPSPTAVRPRLAGLAEDPAGTGTTAQRRRLNCRTGWWSAPGILTEASERITGHRWPGQGPATG